MIFCKNNNKMDFYFFIIFISTAIDDLVCQKKKSVQSNEVLLFNIPIQRGNHLCK